MSALRNDCCSPTISDLYLMNFHYHYACLRRLPKRWGAFFGLAWMAQALLAGEPEGAVARYFRSEAGHGVSIRTTTGPVSLNALLGKKGALEAFEVILSAMP